MADQTDHPAIAPPDLEPVSGRLRLLASHQRSLPECANDDLHSGSPSFFNSARWTADGTAVVVGSSDQTVQSFVLPDDLLESEEGRALSPPQGLVKLPEPTQVINPAPYFSLQDPSTQTFLTGCRDHPLQLYHAFPHDGKSVPLCTYKLIRKETEEYITPSSMIWQYPGTHFVCGSANRLDLFDVSGHSSDGPTVTVPTIPSRRHIMKGGGVGMKGTVSALDQCGEDSLIAAGTWTRWVGLYDLGRTDKAVAHWSIAQAADEQNLGGQGVAQTIWSPCGRYLVINERHASGLMVYDVRGTGQLLSTLQGRDASTQQRLHCDVYQGQDGGFEVWAGSKDGTVQVWEDVGLHGDLDAQPHWAWKGHESPVGNVGLHSSGSVIATVSGGWEHSKVYENEIEVASRNGNAVSTLKESSLKLWAMNSSAEGAEP